MIKKYYRVISMFFLILGLLSILIYFFRITSVDNLRHSVSINSDGYPDNANIVIDGELFEDAKQIHIVSLFLKFTDEKGKILYFSINSHKICMEAK